MTAINHERQRQFAVEVVRTLRAAGFVAYWAGGCVRDQLLGRTPKDYDVATDATPPQIRRLFGHRRTIAVGAAFGVITVLGPPGAGSIEVATFRCDAQYSDGRHPDYVTFSSDREDALRRDFTINGLFYDPDEDRVIDYVGGQADLAAQTLRAIGDPFQRFAEDKLRMLRAVRFAAEFGFAVEPGTLGAVREMAARIVVVSAERIAGEMQRMLVGPNRVAAVRLLVETGLAAPVLPELLPADGPAWEQSLDVLGCLSAPSFPAALAALLFLRVDSAGAEAVGWRWKLSNQQVERTAWLVANHAALAAPRGLPWSVLQPLLITEGIGDLLALSEAKARAAQRPPDDLVWCRKLLELPPEALDPPPLVTGDDLIAHGIRPGPVFKRILEQCRAAQLDQVIRTQAEALALADRLYDEWKRGREGPGRKP